MTSVKVILFNHKTLKDGSHPVALQIIKDRKRKLISIGQSKPGHWDDKEKLPTTKHPDSISLKKLILKKRYDIVKLINEFEETGDHYTLDDIMAKINTSLDTQTVFSYMEQLIIRMKKTAKVGNARVYQNTINVFRSFRRDLDLEFRFLDYKMLQEFKEYLLEKGNKENTVSIHLRTLRAVYNSAIKEGIVPKSIYPFESLKIRSEKTIKRAISKEEINALRSLDLSSNSELDKARDFFLFSFNMRGMSFIDIAYLKVNNLNNNRIIYRRRKTGQKFSIKLTDEALKVMKKYNDLSTPNQYIFPVLRRKNKEYLDYRNSMRLTNKKLKILGEMAGSSIPLSTYVSRHSWATIGKRAGLSTSVISEGLGHDSERTTQIYLDSFEDKTLDDANELITQ